MRIVRNEIAAADFQRVHADPGGGELDQSLGHRGRDRMADCSVLAHDVLVLEDDSRAGPIIRAGIGPAGEVDDLVRLDARRARIDRVGPDAGEIVDLPGGDGAVVLRSATNLTGRLSSFDSATVAISSAYVCTLMPNEPPTSLVTTRT